MLVHSLTATTRLNEQKNLHTVLYKPHYNQVQSGTQISAIMMIKLGVYNDQNKQTNKTKK